MATNTAGDLPMFQLGLGFLRPKCLLTHLGPGVLGLWCLLMPLMANAEPASSSGDASKPSPQVSETGSHQWDEFYKTPRCYIAVQTAVDPNTTNIIIIDQRGIGDISNNIFVPMKLVATWTSNQQDFDSSENTLFSNKILFDGDEAVGTHYHAFEFYPVKGPFQGAYFSDDMADDLNTKSSIPINTVIVFQEGAPNGLSIENGSIRVYFFGNTIALKPTRSIALKNDHGYGDYLPVSFAGYTCSGLYKMLSKVKNNQ